MMIRRGDSIKLSTRSEYSPTLVQALLKVFHMLEDVIRADHVKTVRLEGKPFAAGFHKCCSDSLGRCKCPRLFHHFREYLNRCDRSATKFRIAQGSAAISAAEI